MADVIIYSKGRSMQVNIIAQSVYGQKWMEATMVLSSPHIATVRRDCLDDFIEELNKAEVTYEEL